MEKINLQKLVDEAKNIADPVKRAEAALNLLDKGLDVAGDNKNNRWTMLLYILVVVGLTVALYKTFTNGSKINETKQGTIDAGARETIEIYKGLYLQGRFDYLQQKHELDSIIKAKGISDSIMTAQKVLITKQTQSLEYWTNKK